MGGFEGELVLVDDGSTDGSGGVIDALEHSHPRVVMGLHHPHNRGIAAAWKRGVAAARGKLVAIIDADLQYQPEDLLRLRRELYDHSVDVVQGSLPARWQATVHMRIDPAQKRAGQEALPRAVARRGTNRPGQTGSRSIPSTSAPPAARNFATPGTRTKASSGSG